MSIASNIQFNSALAEIGSSVESTELLNQTAEECAELAQAALKLNRARYGTTPVSVESAQEHLIEEMADVLLCIDVITVRMDNCYMDELNEVLMKKAARWVDRLRRLCAGKPLEE